MAAATSATWSSLRAAPGAHAARRARGAGVRGHHASRAGPARACSSGGACPRPPPVEQLVRRARDQSILLARGALFSPDSGCQPVPALQRLPQHPPAADRIPARPRCAQPKMRGAWAPHSRSATRPKRTLPGLLAIYNDVIATSTAIYSDLPVTLEERRQWWRSRTAQGYPVLVGARCARRRGLRHLR